MVLFIILLELLSRMLLFPKRMVSQLEFYTPNLREKKTTFWIKQFKKFNFISNPKYLFLGDSFTFGSGIKTNKTFFQYFEI